MTREIDVTVLLPCLNEENSLREVISQARTGLANSGLVGEILVSDNGSSDRSREIALDCGARVISSMPRGYGAAYLCGLEAARGESIVMADADQTYPIERLGEFVNALADADLVMGIRTDRAGNMPTLNRLVGNPALSGLARLLFSSSVSDFHCGMRAVRADSLERMGLSTPGMEFASEMVIRALQNGMRIAEIPIEYRSRVGESKLQRWRDGWRHLKFLLAHSPTRIFIYPGATLGLIGLAGMLLLAGGPVSLGRPWFVHAQLVFMAMWLVGLIALSFGWLAQLLAPLKTKPPRNPLARLMEWSQERAFAAGLALTMVGILVSAAITILWGASGFKGLRGNHLLVAGIGLSIGGLQLVAASWFRAMLEATLLVTSPSWTEVTEGNAAIAKADHGGGVQTGS